MKYYIDKIKRKTIVGWCFDENDMDTPIIIELYIDGEKIAQETANIYRQTLKEKNIHTSGLAGFVFRLKETVIKPQSKIELKVKGKKYFLDHKKAYIDFLNDLITSEIFKDFDHLKRNLCIVHIGMHKTGTSSIQHNLTKMKNKNFTYFDLGPENHSIPIYSLFSHNRYEYHVHKKMGRMPCDIYNYCIRINKRIRNNIRNNITQDTFVLSAEDIVNLSLEELKYLQKYLHIFFKNIKIVAYVRAPFSYTVSAVQQAIKSGLNRWEPGIQKQYPEYKSKFQKYDHVFTKENVYLHYFAKNNLIEHDITKDFLAKNNLYVNQENFATHNETLALEAVALLYIYNKYGSTPNLSAKGNLAKSKLINSLSKIGEKKFSISKKRLNPILDTHREDLMWIEKRMHMKLSDEVTYCETKDAVASEEDLYEVAKMVIHDLENLIVKKNLFISYFTKNTVANSPQDIALLIDKLYQKIYRQL